ncbi:MAG: cupin domain-containing protein [bacterium]
MIIQHYKDVDILIPEEQGIFGVKMRKVISEKEGAKNFIMRVFEIEKGGYTPLHKHDWEHEVFVLNGSGIVIGESGESMIKSGDVVFIPGGEMHQFKNLENDKLEFICLIPARK